MGWEGWAPPMFFDRGKIIIPVAWRFSFIVFFRISSLKDMEWKNFGYIQLHAFQGITVLKPLMFKKNSIVNNDVCSYTVLGECVWLYKGKRYSPLAKKKRFPTEKRYSPLMCRNKERIVCYDSYWFKVCMYVVKGQKRIHSIEFQ